MLLRECVCKFGGCLCLAGENWDRDRLLLLIYYYLFIIMVILLVDLTNE